MNSGAFGENFPYTNFHDLNLDWIIKIVREVNEKYPALFEELMEIKINKPSGDPNGQLGDYLVSNGDGSTQWKKLDEEIETNIIEAVNEWLDEHPEATTTVEDHSLEKIKFTYDLENRIDILPKSEIYTEFLGRLIQPDPYRSAQGFLATVEDGTEYLYTAFYNYDNSDPKSIIVKMTTNGNIVLTSNAYALDHSNDMCTDGTYIYVAGYNSNKLFKLTKQLVLVETITLPLNIQAITYDAENQLFYAYNTHPTPFIYTINPNFTNYETFLAYNPAYGVETIEYFNNMLLITENAPNTITTISTITKDIIGVIKFNEFMSDYYPIGEMQAISIKENGDYYLLGKPRLFDPTDNNYEIGRGIASYGKGNLFNGETYLARYANVAQKPFTGPASIDPTTNVFTPTGTVSAPFNTAGDFVICLESPYFKPSQLNLRNGNLPDTLAIIEKTLYITGYGAVIHAWNSTVTCQSMEVMSGSQFINSRVLCRDCTGSGSANNSVFYSNTYAPAITMTGVRSLLQYPNYYTLGTVTGSNNYEETLTITVPRPRTLIFARLNGSIFSETEIIPYTSVNNADIESESYKAHVANDNITITVKSSTQTKIRVFMGW